MHVAYYGKKRDMHGVEKLKKMGIVQDYYALHDGAIQIEHWHNDDIINERTVSNLTDSS